MFARLFRPKWQHSNPTVRLRAIERLNPDDPEGSRTLSQLAREDSDVRVRAAAIERLSDPDTLIQLLEMEPDCELAALAARQLCQLHEQLACSADTIAWLASIQRECALTQLLLNSQNAQLHAYLIDRINQQGSLAKLALKAPLASTRQHAAAQLEDEALLEAVSQAARGHDKTIFRITRESLHRQQSERDAAQARALSRQQLLQQLKALLTEPQPADLANQLSGLKQQWLSVQADAPTDQLHTWQSLLDEADAHLQALAIEQAARAQQAAQAEQQQQHLLNRCAELEACVQDTSTLTPETLERALSCLRQLPATEDTALQQRLQRLERTLLGYHDAWQRWLSLEREVAAALEREIDALESLSHQLQALCWPDTLPQPATLQQAHARLQQLKAQQAERETLCHQMEALIGTALEPPALAEAIRGLQQQWKQLDAGQRGPHHLHQRFHRASQKAYAPCDEHFRQQGEVRAWNLSQRTQMCDHLTDYLKQLDATQLDVQGLDTILRCARQEWKQFTPVDRAPGKVIQQRFNQLLQQGDALLQQVREQRAVAKEALLHEAEALLQLDDRTDAMRQMRKLQQRWKAIGATYHSRERQLWQMFRSHCDQLFADHDHPSSCTMATGDSPIEQWQARFDQLEQALIDGELHPDHLPAQEAWHALQPLLRDAFTQRCQSLKQLLSQPERAQDCLDEMAAKARMLCIRLEILLGCASPEQDEVLRMEYQMQRLQEALTSATEQARKQEREQLHAQWLALNFTGQMDVLSERFARLMSQADQTLSTAPER